MNTNRISRWDNLKFFLILTVVLGHFVEIHIGGYKPFKSVFIFIYSFHMPLFIFVSGMFHKNKNIRSKILFYIIFGYCLKIMFGLWNVFIFHRGSFNMLTESGLPWFMFVLAFFTAITYLTRFTNQKLLLVICIAIGCLVGYDSNIGDFLVLSRTIVYFPFFLAGYLLQNTLTGKELHFDLKWKIPAIIILLTWVYLCVFKVNLVYQLRPLFTGRNPFGDTFGVYGCGYRLLCYTITALVSFSLIVLTPNTEFPIISDVGTKTLSIYTWHYIVIYILQLFDFNTYYAGTLPKELIWLFIGCVTTYICSLSLCQVPINLIQKGFRETSSKE